jgi:hypothetical protein
VKVVVQTQVAGGALPGAGLLLLIQYRRYVKTKLVLCAALYDGSRAEPSSRLFDPA